MAISSPSGHPIFEADPSEKARFNHLAESSRASSPDNNPALATKVRDIATRGGAQNVLTSVSNALSKVGQLATQATRECIAHLKKWPLAYFDATVITVGIVLAVCVFAPIASPVVAIVGCVTMGIAHAFAADLRKAHAFRAEARKAELSKGSAKKTD